MRLNKGNNFKLKANESQINYSINLSNLNYQLF